MRTRQTKLVKMEMIFSRREVFGIEELGDGWVQRKRYSLLDASSQKLYLQRFGIVL